MKIIAIGEDRRLEELKEKLNKNDEVLYIEGDELPDTIDLKAYEVLIDTNLDDHSYTLETYASFKNLTVLGCSVKKSCYEMIAECNTIIECKLIGVNFLPGFINRELTEMCSTYLASVLDIENICEKLEWNPQIVEDRVGLVTPRILFMIINEACYTVQEGTSTIDDIEIGMKLGTAYPFGPFEFANLVGVQLVYEVLLSIYNDTKDERYKICSLLKKVATNNLEFNIN
jgi:3-hydroxybutyryl-CoA dehydrogenase